MMHPPRVGPAMDWPLALSTLLRALVAYAVVIAYVRVSGNRTLAKLRAFDLVVTIALGSLLATTILADHQPLWQGLLGLGSLIALQWAVARGSVASRRFRSLVTNDSITVYADGRYDEKAMRRARVTRDEVLGAIRGAGHDDLSTVRGVSLEVNGDISVAPLRAVAAEVPRSRTIASDSGG